jgi:FtsH-binding integral membrane protein
LAQRKRKRGRTRTTPGERPTAAAYRARSEERNAAARAALTPLTPGERPWPLVAASLVALALALTTLGLFLTGTKLGTGKPPVAEVVVYCGLMFACAAGCWRLRYWAVLGFQTLLAIGILGLALALIRVNSALWAGACVVAIAAGGYLFWKLVRVLGRLQLPQPPGR